MARTRTPSKNSWLYAVIPAAALALFVAGTIGHGIAHDNSQQTINTLSDEKQALTDSLNVAKQRLQECIDGKKTCPCKPKTKPAPAKPKAKPKPKAATTAKATTASATATATVSTPVATTSKQVTTPAATATATSATATTTTATQQNVNVDADNNSGIIVVGNGNAVNVTKVVQAEEEVKEQKKYKCYVIDARVKRR